MKSLLYVAPELPPPPYTWLMTICGRARAVAAVTSRLGPRGIFTDVGESLQERILAPTNTDSAKRAGGNRMRRPVPGIELGAGRRNVVRPDTLARHDRVSV